ncbi:MAG: GAF domain-containing protein [Gaiellaceae bacterium]
MAAADVERSLARISAETTVSSLLNAACEELVTTLDAAGCSVSRTIGDLLVELAQCVRVADPLPLALYLVSDYPLTQEVIQQGEPRVVSRADPNADPAETELLERLGFDSLLMLPLRARDRWGLVEIYGDDREFGTAEIETAASLVAGVGELLSELESGVPRA